MELKDKIKDKIKNSFSNFKELKEAEELYLNCLDIKDKDYWSTQQYPCLKYTLCTLLFLRTFRSKIYKIMDDIKILKTTLNDYKGAKVNAKEEIEQLDETMKKLVYFEKGANEDYIYYRHYLIDLAREFLNSINNESIKSIYINTSEEIIKSQIIYYLKYERSFLIINDNINKIKNVLNI